MPARGRQRPTISILRRLAALVLTALVAVPASAAGATPSFAPTNAPKPAPPSLGVAFGIQPASATAGDGRPNFTYGGSPGALVQDHVAVENIGITPLTLDLYAADATLSGGHYALKLQSDRQRDIGAWIAIEGPSRITIPARSAKGPTVRIVPFVMHIPVKASPGDHAGAVLVSLHTNANQSGNSLGLNQRVGARVYLRVAGPVHPGLTVTKLTARYKPHDFWNPFGSGNVAVKYRVVNTGNVILAGSQTVSVSGLFGSNKASKLPDIPQLLPGDYFDVSTTVKNVFPQIRLSVKVKLHPIAPVGAVDPGLKDSSATKGIWAIPWMLLVLILIIGIGVADWARRRNRRRRHSGAHKLGPPPAARRPVSVG